MVLEEQRPEVCRTIDRWTSLRVVGAPMCWGSREAIITGSVRAAGLTLALAKPMPDGHRCAADVHCAVSIITPAVKGYLTNLFWRRWICGC